MNKAESSPNSMPASNHVRTEISAEQMYVSMLYARLDALRERERARLAEAHSGPHAEHDQAMTERQSYHEHYSSRLNQLSAVERGLCFGRLDREDGTRDYVGRIGLFDDEYDLLLIDWRAPAAVPFYRATPAERLGVVRRRHLRTRGRNVLGIEDDVLDLTALGDDQRRRLTGEAALLASLTSGRTGRMADIVATIQAEQDQVIRSDPAGVLVVDGGPGTGKTVVALHRAAYLLYTFRDRLAKRGVLILGPNATFMRYIDQVLPSLGETEVVLATVAELYPGVATTGRDSAEAERVKGDPRMADVIAAAVRDRQQVPSDVLEIVADGETYHLDRATCLRAREQARRQARQLDELANRARRYFVKALLDVLTKQAVDRLGAELLDDVEIADIRRELVQHEAVHAAIDELWPELTPTRLLAELYSSPDRLATAAPDLTDAERAALARPAGQPMTPADVPLLDEAAELLGDLDATVFAASDAAQRQAETEEEDVRYAREMVELQVADEQILLTTPEDLDAVAEYAAGHYRESRRGGHLSEYALDDRQWTYGHVVVDEAQELSAMAWRMVMRRCPARSMTVVGDIAQASAPGGARSWSEALEPYAAGRWRRARLSVNYRTPTEIMAVANDVLAAIDPTLEPPVSVREGGTPPWVRTVRPDELGPALARLVRAEADALDADEPEESGEPGAGRLAVVVPAARQGEVLAALAALAPGTSAEGVASVLDARVSVLTVAQAKGLEFDAVVVVDPEGLLAESVRGAGDLYVAMTRATRRLGVVATGPLPPMLSRLASPPS